MFGAAGAVCCVAAGTALGSWMRENAQAHWRMLEAMVDAVSEMRTLLEQEQPPLPELLRKCAQSMVTGNGALQVAQRLFRMAQLLEAHPAQSVSSAYAAASGEVKLPWEKAEERSALELLFRQLGTGTAGMREQAAAACVRKLRPLAESARIQAQQAGKLCMQLGVLLGLMAGIALW